MADKNNNELFPLPLGPFEQYMLADDREDSPMTFVVKADLTGPLDHDAIHEAIQSSLQRHPLFHATVSAEGFRKPTWVTCDPRSVKVEWMSESAAAANAFRQIDLTSEPGLRIQIVERDDGGTQLRLNVHHAASDGIGTQRFLGDVLAFYGQLTDFQSPPELLPLDPDSLRQRCHRIRDDKSLSLRFKDWREAVRRECQFISTTPTPVAFNTPAEQGGVGQARSIFRVVDRDCLGALRRRCRLSGVTLNDLILHAVFATIHAWNRDVTGNENGRYRLAVPLDLRLAHHEQLPAANVVSYAFPTLRGREIDRPNALERCVEEMDFYVRNRQQSNVERAMRIGTSIPGAVSFFLKKQRRIATAIVSNVGDPARNFRARFARKNGRCVAGSVILERLTSASPLRKGTDVNITVSTYANELTVNLTVPTSSVCADQTDRFMDSLWSHLLPVDERG
jgi:NRPS condensation-like uncharacterized protein